MIPEARQCRAEGHPDFGAVAVKSPEVDDLWGIFHPMSSGRWGSNDDVWDWAVMVPAEQPDDPVIDPEEGE